MTNLSDNLSKINRDDLIKKWSLILVKTDAIPSWTSGHELAWLCEAATQAKKICEIGSYHGKSALCMALANPEAWMVCIDNCENPEVEATFAKNLLDQIVALKVFFVMGTSADLSFVMHSKFEFAFVDAGHQENDVSGDIANLLPHMAPGAILSGHDWRHHDMNDGVNRGVLAHFRLEELRFFESIWFVKLP